MGTTDGADGGTGRSKGATRMATTMGHGRMRRLGVFATAAIMSLTSLAVVAMPAAAREVEREKHGACTRNSDWELDLEKEHGRIEVHVEVDTHRRQAGNQWRVRIWHNGTKFTDVVRGTDRDGEVEVERRRSDRRGADSFHFHAVDRVSGEVCRGTLSI